MERALALAEEEALLREVALLAVLVVLVLVVNLSAEVHLQAGSAIGEDHFIRILAIVMNHLKVVLGFLVSSHFYQKEKELTFSKMVAFLYQKSVLAMYKIPVNVMETEDAL
jgi:hypothetical protein